MSNVGDIEDMANKAISILEDCDVLKQFKENAFKRAQDFDLKKILPEYVNYYNKVIAESHKLHEA
ncbi:hypothetical protein D3C87_2089760 [compost metagenome]